MSVPDHLSFVDNTSAHARPGLYAPCMVNVARVVASWRHSLFSFEWLTADGEVKTPHELRAVEREKRAEVERAIAEGKPLEKPVLGIGLNENIEIGSGRAVFMTLAALGVRTIPVHVPKSHEADFAPFRA